MTRGDGLGDCESPLAEAYDAALYDLDGVLYVGDDAVDHAADSVAAAARTGLRAAFVTNNASRRSTVVAEHLSELGIPASPADVVTSAQATVRLLHDDLPPGSRVLVVGSEDFADEVRAGGYVVVREAGPGVGAVVQGLSPDVGWRDLAEAALVLGTGALWVAANTDSTYPTPRGLVPGCGAMVAALTVATGRTPVVAGKPGVALHRESLERVAAQRPLVVGDRLDTDVLGAVRGGTDSLLVLTGVTTYDALLAAPVGSRPTYVGHDLRALLEPQPPVQLGGRRATCGAATASYDGGVVVVEGEGTAALRAACALAWSA